MRKVSFAILAVCAMIAVGCSNPADNVTEAKVSSPTGEAAVSAEGKAYTVTPASTIGFVGSKVTGSHDGGFEKFSGEFVLVDGSPEGSHGAIEIDMDSTWSDNDRLTGHLKSPDFFGVEKNPTTTFKANKIEKAAEGYTVTGELTLHGVTKAISFPAQIAAEDDLIKLNAEFFVKRFDFEIKYPGKADDLIRDEVVIKLDIIAKAA
ncbi:MAG: YceI family protein [Candidatus Hinthialibacter antarcticus]|nr:YceI family protein [Candidatus Hinthialibacter antarcticus]